MNSKKGTHYLGLFGVVIFALVVLRFFYPALYKSLPYNRFWPMKRARAIRGVLQNIHKDRSFSLVMGSCSAESTFRADVLEKLSGAAWYNFSLRGATPVFYSRLAQKIEDLGLNHSLDTVLLVISPTDLTFKEQVYEKSGQGFEDDLETIEDLWNKDSSLVAKSDAIFKSVVLSNIAPWSFTSSLKNLMDHKSNWALYRKLTYSSDFEDDIFWDKSSKGSVGFNFPRSLDRLNLNRKFLFEQKRNEYFNSSEKLEGRLKLVAGTEQIQKFMTVVDRLKGLARQVIIVIPPEFPGLYKRDAYRALKRDALFSPFVKNKLRVLDLSREPQLKEEDFLDLDHLHSFASLYLTQELFKKMTGESR